MRIIKYLLYICLLLISACSAPAPKILIIGDSISLGYTPFVEELLDGNAEVYHNKGNAQHTGTGLNMLEEWIGDGKWDIIQCNWGLWDLCYRHDSSTVQGKRDKQNGTVTFKPEEYKANLDSIAFLMKSLTKAKLLFVSTSYVPEGEAGRYVNDALLYNQIAEEVMKKHKIPVNNIYNYSKEIHKEHATAPDNVHFTESGYKKIAVKVVDGLSKLDRRIRIKD